jgi:hypothetical protein
VLREKRVGSFQPTRLTNQSRLAATAINTTTHPVFTASQAAATAAATGVFITSSHRFGSKQTAAASAATLVLTTTTFQTVVAAAAAILFVIPQDGVFMLPAGTVAKAAEAAHLSSLSS